MAEKEPEKEYRFTLKRIVLLEKTMSLKAPVNKGDEFAFDVSLQVDGKPDTLECVHVMSIKVTRKSEKESLGSITLGCTFSIPNYQEYILTSEDKVSLPIDLINLLNSAVIGTIRGVMFSEFRGTFLGNAYLPILDPRRFIKKD